MKRLRLTIFFWAITAFIPTTLAAAAANSPFWSIDLKMQDLIAISPRINPQALKLALIAYQCATSKGQNKQNLLTILDYSKPSSANRLWVFDLLHNKVLFNTLVAHGKGSGSILPTYFSDIPETHTSSIGVFLTGKVYEGQNGYSLKLHGLEKSFNEKAEFRSIVMHGAPYVNNRLAKVGEIGRSWGCPAIAQPLAKPVINTIKGGSILFAYYPDTTWLKQSSYLHCNIHRKLL